MHFTSAKPEIPNHLNHEMTDWKGQSPWQPHLGREIFFWSSAERRLSYLNSSRFLQVGLITGAGEINGNI